jgi:ATP-binding cassette subfamily B protein
MIAFGWVTNILQRGMASWARMLDIMDAVPDIADDHVTERGRALEVIGAIEFRGLRFAYPGAEQPVLDGVTLRIPAGTIAAFVGGTGSGKSTLMALLPRLHEPPPGTVFLDGVDVREVPLATLRGAIGFVPQEPFLFSDSLAANVAFADPSGGSGRTEGSGGTDARTAHAAGVARLDKDLEEFPKGYDTVIGERGITLSGGQKQRAAIARAVFANPPILILDDALSAVDTYTEDEILARLRGVMRERTSIIVAHRVSTVRHADQIFVLDRGRIVERGTHDALVALDGLYASMYRKQLLEEELEAS